MNESMVDRALLWMVSGLSGPDLENALITKLEVDPAEVKAVMGEARKRLTLAAEYNRDEMLGTALTRLNDLYSRCIRTQNDAKALDVQREINRVAGLHRETHASEAADESLSESASELAAIAPHLLSLGLAAESYPLREHARLAAQRIKELENERPTEEVES